MNEISAVRIYALRAVYLLNLAGGAWMFWPALLHPSRPLDLFEGFAFSFWAGLTTLMGLGLRYPLRMLPLLLLQLFYKTVWLLAVALPLWSAGRWDARATSSTRTFVAAVAADLLVIPWAYVVEQYVRQPGERWKPAAPSGSRALGQAQGATR